MFLSQMLTVRAAAAGHTCKSPTQSRMIACAWIHLSQFMPLSMSRPQIWSI